MTFTIREATVQDAEAIAEVQVASWRSTYRGLVSSYYLDSLGVADRAQQWKLRLNQGAGIFSVAEDSSGLFGFLAGGAIRQQIDGYDAELYAIYLLKEKQGLGAGLALVRKCAQKLKDKGYQGMSVWILSGNSSRGFYERLGGVLIARDEIEIGGELLPEVAYGWPSLDTLINLK